MNDSASGRPGLHAERGAGPNPDPGALSEGVSSSLSELERKLRLLEGELAAVTNRDAPVRPGEGAVPTSTPADSAPAWQAGGDADDAGAPPRPWSSDAPEAQDVRLVDEGSRRGGSSSAARGGEAPTVPSTDLELLLRFRDQLERYSRALVTDYGRLLSHLGIDVPPPTAWPAPTRTESAAATAGDGADSQPSGEATARHGADSEPSAEAPNEYSGRGVVYEDILLEGSVVLEVGPLAGLEALQDLEEQLAGLSGVQVRVRAFEGGRAVFDLRLGDSRRLVQELRGAVSREFFILDAAPGRLSIVLAAAGHDA